MSESTPLNAKQVYLESKSMSGALGAISYGVLKGLLAGGADEQVVASVRAIMQDHFQRLSDADCNVLCDVVHRRLAEEVRKGGRWY